ncbi:hypothetical protein [Christiangramia sediminis]|uniref:Uncharacterized protein n=1 Tax=Christiangramia sediminis TaxID=2881336 RepID=A0A9X1LHR3_9FLAO|nr:hypothetical protein [Christiangramia sediminis]MCB7480553.1 hypothetical protein [Christiangramia sediminis]
MSLKKLILLLLLPVFLGKLFMVDASAINLLSQGNITFVKPFCKKKKSNSDSTKTYEFEKKVETNNSWVEISSFCTPQFNFNAYSWNFSNSEVISAEDVLFTSRLSYLYLDSHSPPPKFV